MAFNGESNHITFPQVQVRVRSDIQQYETGLQLAREIREAINYAAPDDLTEFIDARTIDSEPNYLGEDEDGHPEWSINVQLTLETMT